ncbi:unnamed protein product [Phytophthora fragariaefolia]|uniref:Unnamed protein product n=1 Tax=Phytophthora fragariaefolia TaxID=1490495 RepID=A0A9W6U0R6_9STRA|nr:unnamed protein product [Phytophthora fragariaefolia]
MDEKCWPAQAQPPARAGNQLSDHGVLVEFDIQPLLLRRSANERSRAEGVTKTLQRSDLTLSGVRRLFDHIIASYPTMKHRLSASAPIVSFPNLKSGIVKLQRCEVLSQTERAACEPFKRQSGGEVEEVVRSNFVVEAFKKRRVMKRDSYMDVLYVPPTSDECERFFSSDMLVFTDLRKSMDIDVLESLTSLLYNRDMWSVDTVERIRSRIPSRGSR